MLNGKIALLSMFALGGASFIPFFMSGHQIRKWNVKVDGEEVSSAYFPYYSEEGQNQLLKGGWAFINQKKNNEENIFSNGSFDIAIPTDNLTTTEEKPNIPDNIMARILYCNREDGEDMVKATTGSGEKTIYCRDLSDSWYLGRIKGNHYSTIFAVVEDGFWAKGQKESMKNFSKITKDNKGEFNSTLIKILQQATKSKKEFRDNELLAKAKSSSNYIDQQQYSYLWCAEEMCFVWGTVSDIGSGSDSEINCQDSFENCEIEIFDISKKTDLKSISHFWNFSGRLTATEIL